MHDMSENEIKHFNIRVYGIIINEKNEVLVSDEYMLDTFMTKFPEVDFILGKDLKIASGVRQWKNSGRKWRLYPIIIQPDFSRKQYFMRIIN